MASLHKELDNWREFALPLVIHNTRIDSAFQPVLSEKSVAGF